MKIFDIETDGLLKEMTKVHCLVIRDVATGEVDARAGVDIPQGLRSLMEADRVVGHNVINFDIPAIQKVYPWFKIPDEKVIDTLVMSRMVFANLGETDEALVKTGRLPSKLWGSHSLKAWGYRTGNHKGDYSDAFKERFKETYKPGDEWKHFSHEMMSYCVQDTAVTATLLKKLKLAEVDQRAIDLEHHVAFICDRMTKHGWKFDVPKAVELYGHLGAERDTILREMQETFQPLVEERWSEKTGKRLKDKVTEFNPGSRDQIAYRLKTKYGWKPTKFTESGKAQVDEETLGALEYPEAKILARYFLLEKRIGMLAEGKNAWLRLEEDGWIHGSINTGGTVSGRCSHGNPNLAQVPSVSSAYGKECRSLFGVPRGFKQVGVDLSGIELRCLAHYMAQWDNGAYGEIILNGDIHTENQKAMGLETRPQAKTTIYALIYGSGDEKLGSIIGKGRAEGKALKERTFNNIPALGKLKKAAEKRIKERGFLVGLDGRKLYARSLHSCLNLLLQSAGAVIAKRWLVEVDLECKRRGYVWGKDYAMLGFIHDETQWQVREDLAEEFSKMVVMCAARAGEYFNFAIRVDAEGKIGNNWYDTH